MGRIRQAQHIVDQIKRNTLSDKYSIPQRDGSVLRFSKDEIIEAWKVGAERLRGVHRGEPLEDLPTHPAIEGAVNSTAPRWATSFLAVSKNPRGEGSE